jgi:AraC-like DNA-binding protein
MPSLDWARVDVAVPSPSQWIPGISMAGFHHHAPAPAAAPVSASVPAPVEITMIAHPAVTLIIDLNGGAGIHFELGGRRHQGSAVIGLAPHGLRTSGRQGACLQIRLDPLLVATPELDRSMISLEDLWGRDAEQAEDRIRSATSWPDRFAVATEILRRHHRAGARRPIDAEVAHVWRRARSARGRVRVEALAAEIGWSRQRLWSRFHGQIGMSPKQATRLIRFDHAAHLLAAGRSPADAAATSGYTDQSHLHRDVREFTGQTPAALAVAPWLAIDPVAWPSPATAGRAPQASFIQRSR